MIGQDAKNIEISKSKKQISSSTYISLKNLIFYVHQNYLHLCTLLCQKLPAEASQNIWYKRLETILSTKIGHGFIKGEELVSLLANNTAILQIIRNILISSKGGPHPKKSASNPFLNCVGNILNQMDKCSILQAREFLTKALKASVFFKELIIIF